MARNIRLLKIIARDTAIKGADDTAEIVEGSMGPAGMTLMMEKGNTVTKDGKKISEHLSDSTEDAFERRGALFQHQGAVKVEQLVKDSTSAYFSLSRGIRKALLPYLPSQKVPIALKPVSELKKQLKKEFEEISTKLKEVTKPIESREELIKSALVSVQDEELAELIGGMQWDLFQATGEGIIKVEPTADWESSIERTTGIYMDNGFATALLINNPEKESLEIKDVNVLITNYVIAAVDMPGQEKIPEKDRVKMLPITNLLTEMKRNGKTTLAVFARAFDQLAMKEIEAWARKGMYIFPINAPYSNQSQVFLDMAAVTGATYITDETKPIDEIGVNDIGFSKNVSCGRHESFVSGSGDIFEGQRAKTRIETIEKELEATNSEHYKETLQARIAGLKGAYAILRVGAKTDDDRKRKVDQCDDAVGAVRNALKSGTVEGAGKAFYDIAETLPKDYILKEPLRRIYTVITQSLPSDNVIPEWCRDPYISLITALEIAIDNSLNMVNTMALDVSPNPPVLDNLLKKNE